MAARLAPPPRRLERDRADVVVAEEDLGAVLALLLEDAAVQHRHLLAREAGALVEAVDVLRHEEAQLLAPRQLDERAVRQRRPRRRKVDLARRRRRCGCRRGRGHRRGPVHQFAGCKRCHTRETMTAAALLPCGVRR